MAPTFDQSLRFTRDLKRLSPDDYVAFKRAVSHLIDDLRAQRGFRKGLRVKRVQGATGVWEMTWAPDGRATFEYGVERQPGETHVIWRRVGSHNVFREP